MSNEQALRDAAEFAIRKSDNSMRCWGCSRLQVKTVGGFGPEKHDNDCFIEKLRTALAATAATPPASNELLDREKVLDILDGLISAEGSTSDPVFIAYQRIGALPVTPPAPSVNKQAEKWHGFIGGFNGKPEFCKYCGEPERSWRHAQPAPSVEELRELSERATAGEWRTGREDMQSYDGETGKPFRSIYCENERAEMHLGHRLPFVVARLFGEDEKDLDVDMANAAFIVASVNYVRALLTRLGQKGQP